MIEARRTEEPGGWSEGVAASNNLNVCMFLNCKIIVGYDYVPDDILSVDDLRDVKDNPGDVAAKEHKYDADDDGREVDLFLHRLSFAAV